MDVTLQAASFPKTLWVEGKAAGIPCDLLLSQTGPALRGLEASQETPKDKGRGGYNFPGGEETFE